MTQMKQAPDKAQKAIDKLKEAVKQSAVAKNILCSSNHKFITKSHFPIFIQR